MRKTFSVLLLACCLFAGIAYCKPDTVKVGIYITSVHDIDFKEKEYAVNLWLWLKYKRAEFDFMRNLEVPMAKSFEKEYATLDTLPDGSFYLLMKLQCQMKGTWRITQFPFDRQRLRFGIENSKYDVNDLVFKEEKGGDHYGKYFMTGWEKDSFNIKTSIRKYETNFGDPAMDQNHSEYSAYQVTIVVHRQSWELFFKIFLGMYIAFLISFVCFYIHPDHMDSRLALSVGSLFAVVGNKYIIDSSLPETNTFTLVDTLHGITLFYILIVILSSVYSLRLIKTDRMKSAERSNRNTAVLSLVIYILLNTWFIYMAVFSEAAG
jgi:hypothetical protein